MCITLWGDGQRHSTGLSRAQMVLLALEVSLQILLLSTASAEPLQAPCSSRWMYCCSTEAWSDFPSVDAVWHLALARDAFQWEVWVWPP